MFMQRWKTSKYTAGQNGIIINTSSFDPARGPKSVKKLSQAEFHCASRQNALIFLVTLSR